MSSEASLASKLQTSASIFASLFLGGVCSLVLAALHIIKLLPAVVEAVISCLAR